MTVHTPHFPSLRLFIAFLTSGWAPHVDFDPTEPALDL